MTITTYDVNNLMRNYSKQTRLINQRKKNVQLSFADTIRLSAEGKRRLFERMQEQTADKIKIQCREK
ncbi:MAG: hypothetical protein KAJ00_04195 [Deltaproteobacteria bacterium]|jgi:hypothetical protein|nr:hypothetical protein [Deltaproteobacteria bacterium]MCK5513677.1 hypothetical protein [Deltaproteobacteria bacterium]NOQ86692.1 hypothetical protein [Deltaproteobacteria bacterium]